MRIVLVGCSKQKRASGTWPAQDLYTSPLFRRARAWAEAVGDRWFILSGEYGIVRPDLPMEPYDSRLTRQDERWVRSNAEDLGRVFGACLMDEVIILAGWRYAERLAAELRGRGYRATLPLRGMQIGERLAWFNRVHGEQEVLPL